MRSSGQSWYRWVLALLALPLWGEEEPPDFVAVLPLGRRALRVVQRWVPETGFPGDRGNAFGLAAQRPRVYMQGNWNQTAFVTAQVRLAGNPRDQAPPSRVGRCLYARSLAAPAGTVAVETAFRTKDGATLRVRALAWESDDAWSGVGLHYQPPPDTRVEALSYRFVCHPYDLSDRGEWQRRRCLTTASGTVELGDEAVSLPVTAPLAAVFHNRLGQDGAGATMALRPPDWDAIEVGLIWGQQVRIDARPTTADGWHWLLIGDWIDEPAALRLPEIFADPTGPWERLDAVLAACRFVPEPLPPALLADAATAARSAYEQALADVDPASADSLAACFVAADALRQSVADTKAGWVTERQWEEP